MIVAMVVLGGLGHLPGVILGAVLLSALPEVLRYVADPLQAMTDGRLDPAILRQLLIALAMITVMLVRPRGLWPAPEHGKVAKGSDVSNDASHIQPASAQANPPGIDSPSDAIPGTTSIRQDSVHP